MSTHDPAAGHALVPRTRRAMLMAAAGSVGALVASALGRHVPEARAAAGAPFVIGQANDAGSSQSVILSTAGGAAFTLKDSAASGTGVFGWSSATGGGGRGLYGRTDSPGGYGLQAKNLGAFGGNGAAIDAQGGLNRGVQASTLNGDGTAIYAINSGSPGESPGTAIYASSSYRGIMGFGSFNGIYGASSTGSGIAGGSTSGPGVLGASSSGVGVQGNSTTGIAVYGNSPFNWSVLAEIDARVNNDFQVGGNMDVAGLLTKGMGAFKIDHPLDPAGKYLYHSFVESPDMLNVYNGLVRLDERGEATVTMAAWFHALNRDFRYQLTALDRPAADLHVKARLRDGRFTIAGGSAGQEVSWQVTGIRRDALANANRIEVEVAKEGTERGTYLHPAAHGQPATKRVPGKYPTPTLTTPTS